MKKLYLGALTVAFLLGCGDNNAENKEKTVAEKTDAASAEAIRQTVAKLSDDIINDIIQSIPSPLEISMLIKETGSEYNKNDLNPHTAVSNYSTNFKKALNLGVYSTDLGFANIYGKNQDAINYLNSVKTLADGLSIGQFFDYNTLKKLAESKNNLDTLIQTTTDNFEKINYHLREQKRESLSILILVGGWIEAAHLTSVVYQKTGSALLKEKLGEQKIVLDQILLVLDVYKSKPEFPELIAQLRELQRLYDQIEIETVYEEPTMQEGKDGKLEFIDNSKSVIKITDQDVKNITTLIRSIRNKIIS
ncbi:MAG: hypothetical protein NZM38_07395 [Cytophagales bacterium]|nr:hypothetical protein [Cytophagales bacterium]MDW8384582.1 hypothetical protein [Flammeovirgaceae bacterium]